MNQTARQQPPVTLSSLTGIATLPDDLRKLMEPFSGPLRTAIANGDAEAASTYLARAISEALVKVGLNVRFSPRQLKEFVERHKGWAPIEQAIYDDSQRGDNARAAVLATFTRNANPPAPLRSVSNSSPPPGEERRDDRRDGRSQSSNNHERTPARYERRPPSDRDSHDDRRPQASQPERQERSRPTQANDNDGGFQRRQPSAGSQERTQRARSNDGAVVEPIFFSTPEGEAIYPHLHTPDMFKSKDGVYKTQLAIYPEDMADDIRRLEQMRDEFAEAKRAELRNKRKFEEADALKIKPIGKNEYDDTGRATGRLLIKAKSLAVVHFDDGTCRDRELRAYDCDARQLEKMPAIFEGSKLCLSLRAQPYYKPDNVEVGITMYLEAVQIVDLVTGGARAPQGDGFQPRRPGSR